MLVHLKLRVDSSFFFLRDSIIVDVSGMESRQICDGYRQADEELQHSPSREIARVDHERLVGAAIV